MRAIVCLLTFVTIQQSANAVAIPNGRAQSLVQIVSFNDGMKVSALTVDHRYARENCQNESVERNCIPGRPVPKQYQWIVVGGLLVAACGAFAAYRLLGW